MLRHTLILLFAASALAGCTSTPTTSDRASAEIHAVSTSGTGIGELLGWANFTEKEGGKVDIQFHIRGLAPGKHGVHIHANGACGTNGTVAASQAGSHFNPDSKLHGDHAGDLGNLEMGTGWTDRTISHGEIKYPLTLSTDAKYGILDRAIVIHALEDDGKTDPTGKSGDRVACGVIKAV